MDLLSRVEAKERVLDAQYAALSECLSNKEVSLQNLFKLFVQKLKELETSFVEIGQEVTENDSLHHQ